MVLLVGRRLHRQNITDQQAGGRFEAHGASYYVEDLGVIPDPFQKAFQACTLALEAESGAQK